jgi:hypothetical protein
MIFRVHHIGITVDSLTTARKLLSLTYQETHVQHAIPMPSCLDEVAINRQPSFAISLQARQESLDIELIEYPVVMPRRGALLPWEYAPGHDIEAVKAALRDISPKTREGLSLGDLTSLIKDYRVLNAVVVPIEDIAAEHAFWQRLGFKTVHADKELVVLRHDPYVPPAGPRYILLHAVSHAVSHFTDMAGVSEIALLCSSCSVVYKRFPEATRTSISELLIAGRRLNIGYVRSPAGVLVELFSLVLS